LLFFQGCAVNPVTGKQELSFVSEATEIKIGRENYLPTRQSQGGEYLVDPGLSAYVNSVGQSLVKVSGRPNLPYEFVVLNNSIPNAWALPGGKIAVNRGLLLELNSEAELAAVLGHEIVHAAARHGAKGMERGVLLQAGMVGIGVVFADNEYSNIIVGGASLGVGLISSKYSRKQELESDYYGMQYMAKAGYDPKAAIDLQKAFVRLSEGKKSDWMSGLFASHPPSQERVDTNRETAKALPSGGYLRKEEFRKKIAGIKKSKPAYDSLEKGQKALAEKKTDQALKFTEEAIAVEPREALFYELKADVMAQKKRYKKALAHYNNSIAKNDRFFRFFLKRGLLKEKMGDKSGAESDLQKSNALLPTALAHNSLGNISLASGQKSQAMEHFSIAATSNSRVGKKAGIAMARLELTDKPEKYIAVRIFLNSKGYVGIDIRNMSPVTIKNVAISLILTGYKGVALAKGKVYFQIPIPPGRRSAQVTRIGPFNKDQPLPRINTRIIRADVVE
jgi:predicted Zn-dependent protease